jgi:hypothetical protein
MSQLSDLEQVVCDAPVLSNKQKAHLFFEIVCVLGWDIDGVLNGSDAHAYLMMQNRLPFEAIK